MGIAHFYSVNTVFKMYYFHIYVTHWFDENMFAIHRYERFLERCKTYISYLWSSISLTSKPYVYVWNPAGGSPPCLFMGLNILWMLLESPVDLSHNKVKNVLFRHIKTIHWTTCFHDIWGWAFCFQLTYFSCDDCENMCTFYWASSNCKNETLVVV